MKKITNVHGFTMIEIIIVSIIIGILASVAIPKIASTSIQPVFAEGVSVLSAIRNAQEIYYLENSRYEATGTRDDIGDLDLDLTASSLKYYDGFRLRNRTFSAYPSGGIMLGYLYSDSVASSKRHYLMIFENGDLYCHPNGSSTICDQFKAP